MMFIDSLFEHVLDIPIAVQFESAQFLYKLSLYQQYEAENSSYFVIIYIL